MTKLAEIAREAIEAANAGDVDGLLRLCSPDIEFEPFLGGVDGGVYRGQDAVREWFTARGETFGQIDAAVDAIVDFDGLVLGRISVTWMGDASGIEGDQCMYGAGEVSEGQLLWWGFYGSRRDALEAAVRRTEEIPNA